MHLLDSGQVLDQILGQALGPAIGDLALQSHFTRDHDHLDLRGVELVVALEDVTDVFANTLVRSLVTLGALA